MCGIFGILNPHGLENSQKAQFESFFASLRHRGPDGFGEYLDERISVGMVRLSILDYESGKQPFWNTDGSIGVFANGEIYNYLELRKDIESHGYRLKSNCDIEVLLPLYEIYGLDFVKHLNGMFAIVIVDNTSNEVHLIRDPLGEKPLFVVDTESGIVFSSELKSLIQSNSFQIEFESEVVGEYLKYGFLPEPLTFIKGVRKLEAGTIESFSRTSSKRSSNKFWDLNKISNTSRISGAEFFPTLSEVIRTASRADVQVGLALSGGLDSSIIASILRHENINFQSFTIGYTNRTKSDETNSALEFAESIGIKTHTLQITPEEVGDGFLDLCLKCDEPIADISGYSYLSLAKLSHSNGVKVLLTGQGADEFFWGYEWAVRAASDIERRLSFSGKLRDYWHCFKLDKPPMSLGPMIDWVKSCGGTIDRVNYLREDRESKDWESKTFDVYRYHPKSRAKRKLISKLVVRDMISPYSEKTNNNVSAGELVTRTLANTYLRSNGLLQIDRLCMSVSVEARSPFVDLRVVEVAIGQLNKSNSFHLGTKAFLKDSISGMLPKSIIGKQKQGFTPPIRQWYKAIHRKNKGLFQVPRIVELGLVNEKAIEILRKPTSMIQRPTVLWYELAVLEAWVRGVEKIKSEKVLLESN
jgi:asparagine synthase (glutamine-hydrolysing)